MLGMGFPFFPKLLCPSVPVLSPGPGAAPREQHRPGGARGQTPGGDVSNSSRDSSPPKKNLRIRVKRGKRDHFKSVLSHQSTWKLLKASRSPQGLDAFPRSLQGFVFFKVSFPDFERFQRETWTKAAQGNVCSVDEDVANLTPNPLEATVPPFSLPCA